MAKRTPEEIDAIFANYFNRQKRKKIKAKRSGTRRGPNAIPPDQWRNPKYITWLADRLCVACTCEVRIAAKFGDGRRSSHDQFSYPSDPCHGPVNGTSSKGPDAGAIPMCRRHHDEQHSVGWRMFERVYEFSRAGEAVVFWEMFKNERKGK